MVPTLKAPGRTLPAPSRWSSARVASIYTSVGQAASSTRISVSSPALTRTRRLDSRLTLLPCELNSQRLHRPWLRIRSHLPVCEQMNAGRRGGEHGLSPCISAPDSPSGSLETPAVWAPSPPEILWHFSPAGRATEWATFLAVAPWSLWCGHLHPPRS